MNADSFHNCPYCCPEDSLFLPGTSSKLVLHWTEFRSRTQIKSAVKTNAVIEARTWPTDPAHLNAISEGIMMYYSSFLTITLSQMIFEILCAIFLWCCNGILDTYF